MAPIIKQSHCVDLAALELNYERSTHLVHIVCKDEAIRKLKYKTYVLEDDVIDLQDLLAEEEDRVQTLEHSISDNITRAEHAEGTVIELETELNLRDCELSALRAESAALKNATTSVSKLMTEKLELVRELSELKPELQYLRNQVAINKDLLSEKLALQHQVSNFEVELGNAKREAQRALAKRRNTMADMAQADEFEALQKTMSREKRLREKAEQDLEQLRRQLDSQKNAAQHNTSVETAQVQKDAQLEIRCESLATELAKEKKDKARAQKSLEKAQGDWDARRAVLEEKLEQFRNKVRSNKTTIADMQAALDAAAEAKAAKPKTVDTKEPRQTKKRAAVQMDPDASTLGTPGDKPANKRSRKMAKVGEKSTFSTTPFLNRTMSVIAEGDDDAHSNESEAEPSPVPAITRPKASSMKNPLQAVSDSERNIQQQSTKTTKVPLKNPHDTDNGATSDHPKTFKPRKSIVTFATFAMEPEVEKNKKRKLGGLGRTLFDEEDDDGARGLPAMKGGFANTKIGRFGGAKGSLLLGGKRKGLITADDGFQFSPLKVRRA